jgi:hypothetical protein
LVIVVWLKPISSTALAASINGAHFKAVKNDFKIIMSLHYYKFVAHFVSFSANLGRSHEHDWSKRKIFRRNNSDCQNSSATA